MTNKERAKEIYRLYIEEDYSIAEIPRLIEESRINDRLFVDVPLLSSIEANHECVKEISFKEAKQIVEEGK